MRSSCTSGWAVAQSTTRSRLASVPTTLPRIAVSPSSFSWASRLDRIAVDGESLAEAVAAEVVEPGLGPHASAISFVGISVAQARERN